ncbi:ryanodine receptor 2-like [Loxodonta africana]|uniref:ryanodine receptor 2-like n=1 Tax=Loxodonta africana TaxID=9785 RepID=UPI0030D20FB5
MVDYDDTDGGFPLSEQNVPPDLSICTFVLEQSLSVRALQEMLANTVEKSEGQVDVEKWKFMMKTAQGGGHRTLLYGHAILLRHSYSGMVSRPADPLEMHIQEVLAIAFQ